MILQFNKNHEALEADLPVDIAGTGGWFVYSNDEVFGPLTDDEINKQIDSETLNKNSYVWRQDYPYWTQIKRVNSFGQSISVLPSDRFPLAVLFALIVCFTVYFVISAKGSSQFAAKSTMSLGVPSYSGESVSYDLKICNFTNNTKVYVSVAYFDRSLNDWVARGWYPQKKGECKVAIKNLTPPVFGFAETKDGAEKWQGKDGFCINSNQAFVNHQEDCVRNIDADRLQGFVNLDLGSSLDKKGVIHTWEIK
jgi:uncharacterized membrane protein